jgi:hypothetical protein
MLDESRSSEKHAAHPIDRAGLIGAWVNTELSPRGVARVVIEPRADNVSISTWGVGDDAHEDWGCTQADAIYAASASAHDAVAFTATHTVKSMPVVLQANVSKGLLIVSSFQMRFDGDIPEARFAREFFRKASSEPLKLPIAPRQQSTARGVSPSYSASTFVGTWRNTNTEGCGIASVSIESTEAGAKMRVCGSDGSGVQDWGETSVEIYVEVGAMTEPAKLKARYDLGSIKLLMHGWVKQGVLVLALFRRFTDQSGKSNYFDREFFYRTDRSSECAG